MLAAENGHDKIVDRLLNVAGIDVNAKEEVGIYDDITLIF